MKINKTTAQKIKMRNSHTKTKEYTTQFILGGIFLQKVPKKYVKPISKHQNLTVKNKGDQANSQKKG